MLFVADECCPAAIVAALRQEGHDVVSILEVAPGTDDLSVAALADREQRILLTEDYDYGELAVRRQVDLPGVVLLALVGWRPEDRATRVLDVVARFGDALHGAITIVEPKRERVRPLEQAPQGG